MTPEPTAPVSEPKVTIHLNLKEQIVAAAVLGSVQNASFTDWNLIDEFMKTVGLQEDDFTVYGIEKKEEGKITWKNAEKAKEDRPFSLSPATYELFKRHLQKLNDQGALTREQGTIARKLGIFS